MPSSDISRRTATATRRTPWRTTTTCSTLCTYAPGRRATRPSCTGFEAYIDFTIARTAFAEQVTPEIFGRAIPQTMLMHANDINADTLDEILSRLEGRGYRFVTLDAALSDAAYATPDTLVSRSGPSWLWRWAMSKGLKVDFSADPEPPGWVR